MGWEEAGESGEDGCAEAPAGFGGLGEHEGEVPGATFLRATAVDLFGKKF